MAVTSAYRSPTKEKRLLREIRFRGNSDASLRPAFPRLAVQGSSRCSEISQDVPLHGSGRTHAMITASNRLTTMHCPARVRSHFAVMLAPARAVSSNAERDYQVAMPTLIDSGRLARPSVPFLVLLSLLCVVWLAGGASRADALGQSLVRGVAWLGIAVAALGGVRPKVGESRPVFVLLTLSILLASAHCIPLPPGLWQALPGRDLFGEAASMIGASQPWRPLAIVPSGALNALSSLVVPAAVYLLVTSLPAKERPSLPGILLAMIAAATLVGLLQFSGAGFNNLFVNDKPGDVSGTFANRNHFALFLSFGCVLAPVWAFHEGRIPHWRAPVALGLVLLFALTILASGSRTGAAVGAIGICVGIWIVRLGIKRALARYPAWLFPAVLVAIVVIIAIFVLISLASDRAVSITRALEIDAAQDMRARALPTIVEMIRIYFPAGSGLGGFDNLFRLHEPFDLLALTYNNHAHNDFLEIALDAGAPGVLLLLGGILWWAWASIGAWRGGASPRYAVPKLGSAMLLLAMFASIFDYPARTPLIMTALVLAAVWLCSPVPERSGSALPGSGKPL